MPIKIKNFSGKEIYTEIGKLKALTPKLKTADRVIHNPKGRAKKKRLYNKKILNTLKTNCNNNKERIKQEDEKWAKKKFY